VRVIQLLRLWLQDNESTNSPPIGVVLFKFRTDVSDEIKAKFVLELKKLKSLPCVQDQNLIVGGPSITDPISRSHGYHFCLLTYHQDRRALEVYQASPEHHQYVLACLTQTSNMIQTNFWQGYEQLHVAL
jgi:hypothetical protein